MSKLRVLFVGESVLLNTGYATYAREVLKRLHQSGKIELAEMACYIEPNDPRLNGIPWKVYPVIPPEGSEQRKRYEEMKSTTVQFGAGSFENIAVQFKPHIVCGIRDFWMDSMLFTSPFRSKYKLIVMPTVDSYPQNEQWLATYAEADKVFTYQDWSLGILNDESKNKINVLGSAPPAADEQFCPQDIYSRQELKKKFGLIGKTVVGTVMRNQPRKLYPSLFKSFREYLNNSGRTDVVLYCHTSYPDNGWDIPKYLTQYNLSSKVIFSYKCRTPECQYFFPAYFSDACMVCPKCRNATAAPVNVNNGVDSNVLSDVYNLFDLYVQYASLEGFGMPIVEAAACGTPIMATNFSAMVDILKKLKGFPVKTLVEPYEMATGRKISIPDDNHFVKQLEKFLSITEDERNELRLRTRNQYDKHYSYDKTAEKWLSAIISYNFDECEKLWKLAPDIRSVPNQLSPDIRITNSQYAKWLIGEVLGLPSKLGSYMETRLVRDLNYGMAIAPLGDNYMTEDSSGEKVKFIKFDRNDAYNAVKQLREQMNFWEKQRGNNV